MNEKEKVEKIEVRGMDEEKEERVMEIEMG